MQQIKAHFIYFQLSWLTKIGSDVNHISNVAEWAAYGKIYSLVYESFINESYVGNKLAEVIFILHKC